MIFFPSFFICGSVLWNDPCGAVPGKKGGEIWTSVRANGLRRKDSAWPGTGGIFGLEEAYVKRTDSIYLNYKWNRQLPLQIQKSVISEPFKPKSRGKSPGSKAPKFQDDATTTDEVTEALHPWGKDRGRQQLNRKRKTDGPKQVLFKSGTEKNIKTAVQPFLG